MIYAAVALASFALGFFAAYRFFAWTIIQSKDLRATIAKLP